VVPASPSDSDVAIAPQVFIHSPVGCGGAE